ncbi:hypothetical protein B7494_g3648 [Chlorociboria aeruginascens]|nr:hypothetical protein B7494_g3648 [Chlorociboria aeruginascens]
MPSYFYHLKFELYPTRTPSRSNPVKSQGKERAKNINVWVPDPGADIFDTERWPAHKAIQVAQDIARAKRQKNTNTTRKGIHTGQSLDIRNRSGNNLVIDCGPSRASPPSDDSDSSLYIAQSSNNAEPEFPAPAPALIPPSHAKAAKDWRFQPVRIESLDMATRPEVGGESSSDAQAVQQDGINAGLTAGRVTKARYEAIGGKITEVGWGIVHLFRDGEETFSLGGRGLEVYTADEGDGKVEDCTTLCIPAVPSYLTSRDFLGFVGERTREQVSHFRMVMTGRMNRYLVLMKFRDGAVAKKWKEEWDGKVFNSMEPETCHVTFIKSITFQTPTSTRPNTSFPELSHDPFTPAAPSPTTSLKPLPPPTANLVELPTCPVCLERMDDTTGLLTILCQHVFHCACLQKWTGSGCPVCRHTSSSSASPSSAYPYDPSNPPFGSGEAPLCSACDCTDDLWICLICGNVGCGRYKEGHAKEHWKDSAHNFALEIETQHIWDYAEDTWVHRLIREKGDNKVMELPSSGHSDQRGYAHHGREEQDDMVPREKLERMGMEYTHLLTSQLESQRVYFEELVGKAVAKASGATTTANSASKRADEVFSAFKTLELEHNRLKNEIIPNLEKDLEREKKKAEKSSEIARGLGKSLVEEKKVGEGLMKRIEHVNSSMMGMSKELTKVKEENVELREENRDLLFSISGGQKLRDMTEGQGLEEGELEGGTLSVPEKKRGRGKGKK